MLCEKKRPELWRSGEWLLHHDNAPDHTALSVWQFLTKNWMTTASHPPPLLIPGHGTQRFFSVAENEEGFKGKRFQNVGEVREKNDGGIEGYHFARVPELF